VTALLALHGFTGSPRSWDFLPAAPSQRRWVPALVGHLGSDAGSEIVDFESEVDRLARVVTEASPVHVVGYSLGARLALGLAARHPARVARLTLISAHPGLESDAERQQRRAADERWCELLLDRGSVAFVDAWQAQPLWAGQARLDRATLDQKRRERLSHDPAGLVRSLRVTGLAQMPNYRDALARLRVPVTLLAGDLDVKFRDLAQHMAGIAPHAELTLVEGAGHDLLLERPELITEVIRRGNQP
jgi:2-succinyl-6-hydroxy-2,4-cyclohexadiene-1-carboxylate synthase